MKKLTRGLGVLLVLFSFWYIGQKETHKTSSQKIPTMAPLKKITPVTPGTPAPENNLVMLQARAPAQAAPPSPPKPLDDLFKEDTSIKMNTRYKVTSDVRAIPKEKFSPKLGLLLQEVREYAFFRPASSSEEAWPVAYDPLTRSFHPISHILHVKGVTQEIRDQLTQEGFSEYYYQPQMKLVSIESTPQEVLSHYRDFKARGYDVRLEVLKNVNQPK